jgi:hypothetical protein
MRKGGPFVVSLRFNALESMSVEFCAVENGSLGVVVWGYRRLALAMMSRGFCRGEAWQVATGAGVTQELGRSGSDQPDKLSERRWTGVV